MTINDTRTDDNYWDCECEKNYIHLKSDLDHCKICGVDADEMPDSRVNEIEQMKA